MHVGNQWFLLQCCALLCVRRVQIHKRARARKKPDFIFACQAHLKQSKKLVPSRIFVISIFFLIFFLCLLLWFYFIIHRRTTYLYMWWGAKEKSKIKIPNAIRCMRTWPHKTSCVHDAADPRKCSYAVPAEPSGTRRLSTKRFFGKTLYPPRMRLDHGTKTSFFLFLKIVIVIIAVCWVIYRRRSSVTRSENRSLYIII